MKEKKARVEDAGGECLAIAGDMTKRDEADAVVDEVVNHLGKLDIMVNAIGGGAGKVLYEAQHYPDDAWDWIYDINVRCTLVPTQAAVKKMIAEARERGYITYDQLNQVLPPDQVSSEQIEDVMSMLSEMGINVIEDEEAEEEDGEQGDEDAEEEDGDASEEDGGGRILARAKNNLGPDAGGFTYDLEPLELPDHPGVHTTRVL